jgi:hypothetical protein
MKKTDKKRENKLRIALTEVCEFGLEYVPDYHWISHSVNYSIFPDSLKITCAFSSLSAIDNFTDSECETVFKKLIQEKLAIAGVTLKNIDKQVVYVVGQNDIK